MSIALAAIFLAGLAAFVRRSRRRAAVAEEELLRALGRHLGAEPLLSAEAVALAGVGWRLPRRRLMAAGRRHGDTEAVARAAASLLRQPLTPLAGTLNLKIHGTRVRAHLVSSICLDLLAPTPRLANHPLLDLGLSTTYRVDGRADQCVSEDHLQELAIDTRDLHGIACAVLGQTVDEGLIRRVLADHEERVDSADGSATALLLVIQDLVPPGARLAARVEGCDSLTLAPDATRLSPGEGVRLAIDDEGWKIL